MEQLDKEVIDELSEPAKRVFRSLDYRSQRRMLKKAKRWENKKEKNTAKRTDKKEVHHKKANKERAGERERQFY